jgi:hypothetical protein
MGGMVMVFELQALSPDQQNQTTRHLFEVTNKLQEAVNGSSSKNATPAPPRPNKIALSELVKTIDEGSLQFREAMYDYLRKNDPNLLRSIETILPEVKEMKDTKNGRSYLVAGGVEAMDPATAAGRLAASSVAENDSFGGKANRDYLKMIVHAVLVSEGPSDKTFAHLAEEINKHLEMFGLAARVTFNNYNANDVELQLIDPGSQKKLDAMRISTRKEPD